MVAVQKMITTTIIAQICDEIGTPPPKVVEYANCIAIIFRNGDGLKTLVTIRSDDSPDAIKTKIATAFKIKGSNAADSEKVAALLKAKDPVTPRKEIQKHQEAKKAADTTVPRETKLDE
jgi:hypothetical protein